MKRSVRGPLYAGRVMSLPGGRRWPLILLLIAAMLLSACGGADESSEGDDDTAEETDDDEGSDDEGSDDAGASDGGEGGEALVLMGEEIASAELYAAAQAEGDLVLYSGRAEPTELAIIERFTEETGLPVTNVGLPAGQLYERILTERGSDQLGADLIRLSDPTFFSDFMDEGILAPHTIPNWDVIPAEYKDPDGNWYFSSTPMVIIGFNTGRISAEDAPTSWAEMLEPEYAGIIGHPPAGGGGQTWAWALFQRTEFGEEYWEQMAAQDPTIYPSGGVMTQDLVRGEISIGITALPTVATQIADGAPLGYHFPEDGIPLFSQSLGLTNAATNLASAQVFINWSMSLAGATAAAELTTEHHGHPDAPAPAVAGEQIPPLSELPPTTLFTTEAWNEDRDARLDEWNRIFEFTG